MLKNQYSITEYDPPAYVGLVHDNNVIRGSINHASDKMSRHRLLHLLLINTRLIDMFRQGRTDNPTNECQVVQGLSELLRPAHESSRVRDDLNIHLVLDSYHDTYESIVKGVRA